MTRSWFFDPLQMFRYDLIVIDAAVDFETYSDKGHEKSQHAHYGVMSWDEVAAMPVGHLAAPDCLVFVWACAPSMNRAIRIMEEDWSIEYQTFRVWLKMTKNRKRRWGPGYRVRTTAEIILVGTIGNPKQFWVPETCCEGLAREHSRKPDEFYSECERIMPHAYRADIFGRQSRSGWDVFGNEATKFDGEAA